MLPLRAVSMTIMFVALLVMFTSLCTDEWYNVTTAKVRKFNGLWNQCIQYKGEKATCSFLRGWEAIPVGMSIPLFVSSFSESCHIK